MSQKKIGIDWLKRAFIPNETEDKDCSTCRFFDSPVSSYNCRTCSSSGSNYIKVDTWENIGTELGRGGRY